jgi:hypothetical protein
MPDVWASVTELDAPMQERLAGVLETRGAEVLRAGGRVRDDTSSALKTEPRRRVEAGSFFGHIAYASLTARKAP